MREIYVSVIDIRTTYKLFDVIHNKNEKQEYQILQIQFIFQK